jgi:putative membrane protein
MGLILNLLVSGLAVFITAQFLPGVSVDSFITALLTAVVLGLINMFIKPIINILTLPINLLTLGLFSFVVNALMILLVSHFVTGFHVNGFIAALLFSIVLSLVNSVLNSLTK